ncbi:MAG: helix-hairpin-helix domain-containing protein [Clostridiales bacterium]|nr:helix-hairpin-helix domain-containing protein [Clostridiales bacterium]
MSSKKYELILIALAFLISAGIVLYQVAESPQMSPVTTVKAEYETVSDEYNETNAQKVNINSAGRELLMSLYGIGEDRAQAIIDYRSNNGSFRDISEIMEVEGISEKVYEQIKDDITV